VCDRLRKKVRAVGDRLRVLCEVYAELLARVIRHWLRLTSGGPLTRTNSVRAAREVRRFTLLVAGAVPCARRLRRVLRVLSEALTHMRPRHRRRKRPSALELLFEPQVPGSSWDVWENTPARVSPRRLLLDLSRDGVAGPPCEDVVFPQRNHGPKA
jgi:hypothetical protein